ncbi:MAG: 30S ribosomal protein S16 [Planctomycetaceae bacterium]|nr:30S ribosomal protein S16 [Planctomycetaceae bacterium]
MKMFGRRHRPFFRVCVTDARTPRDGRVLEEVGYYDPMVSETDARAVLKGDRIDYWLGVGAQPSDKVAVLIKKYGTDGTHLEQQKTALERLAVKRRQPLVPTDLPKMEPVVRKKKEAQVIEEPVSEEPAQEPEAVAAAPAEEAASAPEPASESAPVAEGESGEAAV